MKNLHLLHVFTDANGNFGDTASVIIDEGRHISDAERQAIAHRLGTGETIFVNDLASADISVMHPQGEIGFAGVGVLATAWLLAKQRRRPTKTMHGRDGTIKVWREDGLTWARASVTIMPPWNYQQLDTPEAVEALTVDEMKKVEHTMAWAWLDETKGTIRARTFATDWDIPEAQGNGSGSMILATRLNRKLQIVHGKGSVIYAEPAPDNHADIGGRVAEAKLVIDRAKPADATAILTLKRRAWLAAYPNKEYGVTVEDIDKKLPESSLSEAIANWERGIAQETENGERITFVARLGSRVVGFTSPCRENGQRRVGALYVDPDFQGQGIGGKLLQKAVDWHGRSEDIYLRVVSYNKQAIRFYETHGFIKTGVSTPQTFDREHGIKLLPEIEMMLPGINEIQ